MPSHELKEIPLGIIDWPSNVRSEPTADSESLAGLSQTIRTHGVQQPIGGYRDGERVAGIFGQRRFEAAKLAGLASIPAVLWPTAPSDAQRLEIQLIENGQRLGLNPIDLAKGIQQLLSVSGMTASQAAVRLGMSASNVSRSAKLLQLPGPIQEQIRRGEICPDAGYSLSQVPDPVQQAEFARQAAGGLGRDALSARIKAAKRGGVTPATPRSRVTAVLDGGRSLTIAGSGLTSVEVLIEWIEELLGKARKVRSQNLELGTFIKMLKDQSKA